MNHMPYYLYKEAKTGYSAVVNAKDLTDAKKIVLGKRRDKSSKSKFSIHNNFYNVFDEEDPSIHKINPDKFGKYYIPKQGRSRRLPNNDNW